MKRIIFMMSISFAFVVLLNCIYPAPAPTAVIEQEPFADRNFPPHYKFYDAEVVMQFYGSTLFKDLTYEKGNLFFMFTGKSVELDSGDIVAVADDGSQFDSNPPIKGGAVELREKRPGLPKLYYEILSSFIEKDVENGVELIMVDYSAADNIKGEENEWFALKLMGMLPTDSKGRSTVKMSMGKIEDFESDKQRYEADNAVHYEISTSDEAEDFFRFSIKKHEEGDNFKEYKGKARLKNGKWQYKLGLWWKTVEN